MADATLQQDWPDRRAEILGVTVVLCALSTIFLLWRMIHGIKTDRKFLVCDYLLVIAGLLNIVTTALRFKTTYHGQGRHIRDPSIRKPYDLLQYSYYLWIGQILNLLAVAILKYSICAYLLALRFSRIYLAIVWASILMVTSFNVLYPMISLFTCKPFEANWNKAIKGDCFVKPSVVMTYFNGVTNIVTDLVYVVAPIIYLSTIQLPRRTQWGLRAVFILSLIPTLCSIMKTTHFNALRKTKDPTWDAVDLSIWSATELSVGILAAALPPLRKQFDKFFRAILPTTLRGTRSKPPSGIPMYDLSKPATVGSKPRKRTGVTQDDDSERSILPNADGAITKTVVHEVTTEKRSDDIKLPSRTFDTNMKV